MPIPAFDQIHNVLPPHLGNPTQPAELSPYPCAVVEVCDRFGTSPARGVILKGLLDLRSELFGRGVRGFQWLDGSFLEDIEMRSQRDPNDIDVVTFVAEPTALEDLVAALTGPSSIDILDRNAIKAAYHVDHFVVSLSSAPKTLVSQTQYWYGLFSHRRDDFRWKGMLVTDLIQSAGDDDDARRLIGARYNVLPSAIGGIP